jgi:hypothetical protein
MPAATITTLAAPRMHRLKVFTSASVHTGHRSVPTIGALRDRHQSPRYARP